VNQEARAAAHVVGGVGVQLVAVRHALEGLHVAEGVAPLRKRADVHLTLAGRVVAARARSATAAIIGINPRAIIGGSVEVVGTLRVGVRTTSGDV